MVLAVLFLCGMMSLSGDAASKTQKTVFKVTKIKLSKKVVKPGDILTIQVNIKTNIKLNSLVIEYVSPLYYHGYLFNGTDKHEDETIVKLKAFNKSKTKWKGTIKISEKMTGGTWGITDITAKLNKKSLERIINNRWCLDSGIKVRRQNLSAGNFKVENAYFE